MKCLRRVSLGNSSGRHVEVKVRAWLLGDAESLESDLVQPNSEESTSWDNGRR